MMQQGRVFSSGDLARSSQHGQIFSCGANVIAADIFHVDSAANPNTSNDVYPHNCHE
jgi:hypothetical protein